MTITITALGSATSTTAGATLAITPTGTIAVGTRTYVVVAADNAGTSGASSISSVTDSAGNTWVGSGATNRTAGSVANDGATLRTFECVLTAQLTAASTVTVNFSPNTTSKAAAIVTATTDQRTVSSSFPFTGVTGSGTTLAHSFTAPFTNAHAGMVLLTAAAVERSAALTADADTTDGTWSTVYNIAASTGTAATSMVLHVAYKKLTTGTVTQSWDPSWTTATDYAAKGLQLFEPKVPAPDMRMRRRLPQLVR